MLVERPPWRLGTIIASIGPANDGIWLTCVRTSGRWRGDATMLLGLGGADDVGVNGDLHGERVRPRNLARNVVSPSLHAHGGRANGRAAAAVAGLSRGRVPLRRVFG